MPKNLIIVHLESISNVIFWQYRSEMENLWNIWENSFSYSRFYAAATSTVMSRNMVMFGASSVYDGARLYELAMDWNSPDNRENGWKHLFNDLYLAGYGMPNAINYATEAFNTNETTVMPSYVRGPQQENVLPHVWTALNQYKEAAKPFWFRLTLFVSHMTFLDSVKDRAESFSDRFRHGYKRLDQAVGRFMRMLEDLELLDNTVVVFYGDHGDELWSHGLYTGWCHAITPYASQCWTPLFILESDTSPGTSDKIMSSIDLRKTLLHRILPDYNPADQVFTEDNLKDYATIFGGGFSVRPGMSPPPVSETEFHGIDVASETRELAFSQNLYALQEERTDISKSLVKGYAVTDGVYRVTVTSGGGDPDKGGLEYFCDTVDPESHRNLLDFFTLDSDGDIREFNPPPEATSRDFTLAFNPEAVRHLTDTYHRLKSALHTFVRRKEEAAKLRPGACEPWFTMAEGDFRQARKRLDRD